jgi:hypothetical protein
MLKNHRDLLSVLIGIVLIGGLWIVNGRGIITLPGEVVGATIAAFTLIVQFYFRKAQTGE